MYIQSIITVLIPPRLQIREAICLIPKQLSAFDISNKIKTARPSLKRAKCRDEKAGSHEMKSKYRHRMALTEDKSRQTSRCSIWRGGCVLDHILHPLAVILPSEETVTQTSFKLWR